jgi:uncharacterized RDD family membrane protein YckC
VAGPSLSAATRTNHDKIGRMTQIPAGWYADPAAPETAPPGVGLRYWNGAHWTEHVAPMPQPAYGPSVPRTPDGEVLAGWWARLLAAVLDGLATGLVVLAVGFPLLVSYLRESSRATEAMMARVEVGEALPNPFAGVTAGLPQLLGIAAVSLVVTVVYHAAFLRWRSRTPGKMVVGLRVRLRETPGQLPWSAIALRLLVQHAASLFSAVPFASLFVGWFPLLDGLWPLWDDKKQALHDKAAGTNVVVHRSQP